MKLSVALFFAGLFGALAAMFVLLSFGTDYWLLASETCDEETNRTIGPGGIAIEVRNMELPDYRHEIFCCYISNILVQYLPIIYNSPLIITYVIIM